MYNKCKYKYIINKIRTGSYNEISYILINYTYHSNKSSIFNSLRFHPFISMITTIFYTHMHTNFILRYIYIRIYIRIRTYFQNPPHIISTSSSILSFSPRFRLVNNSLRISDVIPTC